jgi:hypothetical protein
MREAIGRTRFTIILVGALLLAFSVVGGIGTASAGGARPAANGLGGLCNQFPRLCRTQTVTVTSLTTSTNTTASAVTQTVTTAASTQTVTVTTTRLLPNLCGNVPFLCRTATRTVTATSVVGGTGTVTVTVTATAVTVTTTVTRGFGGLLPR